MTNELEKPIGTQEASKLSAGSVIVREITVELSKEGSKAKIVKFHCKHQDQEDLIKLSNVMIRSVQGSNINIKKDTMWYNEDKEGNIRKGSCVANVMQFYKKSMLKDFKDAVVNTESDAPGYLCIKAY